MNAKMVPMHAIKCVQILMALIFVHVAMVFLWIKTEKFVMVCRPISSEIIDIWWILMSELNNYVVHYYIKTQSKICPINFFTKKCEFTKLTSLGIWKPLILLSTIVSLFFGRNSMLFGIPSDLYLLIFFYN
jgi:hypothetical protein